MKYSALLAVNGQYPASETIESVVNYMMSADDAFLIRKRNGLSGIERGEQRSKPCKAAHAVDHGVNLRKCGERIYFFTADDSYLGETLPDSLCGIG